MRKTVRKEIKSVVDVIKKFPEIEKIILFGSFATEADHGNSDIDLFLVRDDQKQSKRSLLRQIRNTLPTQTFPFDLILMNKEEVQELQASPNSVVFHALKNGQTVYER